ncbi:MAG: hypothetical protein ABI177_08340, partial [Edaphobacter sp.]
SDSVFLAINSLATMDHSVDEAVGWQRSDFASIGHWNHGTFCNGLSLGEFDAVHLELREIRAG